MALQRCRVVFWLNGALVSCVVIGFLQVAHFELRHALPTSSLLFHLESLSTRLLTKNATLGKVIYDVQQPIHKRKRKKQRVPKQSVYERVQEYLLNLFNTTDLSTIPDMHSSQVDILDLLDWELESIEGVVEPNSTMHDAMRTCHPPSHMSQACCIGTFSKGGDIDWKVRCVNKTLQDYYYVRETASINLEKSASEVKDTPCDVCRIVELQHKYNLTIALFGDSVSNQVMQGLTCELQRRNYMVEVSRKFSKDQDCKRCIKWVTTATVRSPQQPTADPATIKFMFQYRYPFMYPQEEDIVASAGDILVINFGLHWNYEAKTYNYHRSHYRKSYGQFLLQLRRKGNFTLLMHRETTAQHFDALAGDFSLRAANSTNRCVPVEYNSKISAWRERMVEQAAKIALNKFVRIESSLTPKSRNRKRPELLVIPYYNFTALHHKMHPSTECSHFCYSPYINYPIWRSIRLAMDRQYGK